MAAGAIMSAGFWPLNAHWSSWICMVPLLVFLPRITSKQAWLYGVLMGLVFYRIGLNWMFALNGPLAGCVIVLLAIWMGLAFRVARLLMDRFGAQAMVWAVPLSFVGQEVLRSEGLPQFRFGFLALGYGQSHNLWISQIASIGGVYLISLLVAAANATVAWVLFGFFIDSRKSGVLRVLAPVMYMSAVVLFLGFVSQPRKLEQASPIGVACVQGETCSYQQFAELTEQALKDPIKPKLVVLPEHTISETANEHHVFRRSLAELSTKYGAYICVGVHLPAAKGAACYYDNVGMMIGPDGKIAGLQSKAVPVPFFQDGNPAKTQAPVQTDYGPVGVAVCYDATFTDVPRRLTAMGAELLVVPVMDPMEWPEQERWQHAEIAVLRSIELRRWQLRAASSGVSQIIDPTGRVQRLRTRDEGPGIIVAVALFENVQTIFTRGGHLLASIIGFGFLLLIGVLTLNQWRKQLKQLFKSVPLSNKNSKPAL